MRVVGDTIEQGVYSLEEALRIAEEAELDLVEIAGQSDPPVCRVIDYSKFKYEQKKKQKEIKSKSAKTVIKEIRFGPQTDEHDFNFKLKHARKFLESGAKLKTYVQFRGRAIIYKEQGEVLLLKFAQGLEDVGKVEQLPQLTGRRMHMMMIPKGK